MRDYRFDLELIPAKYRRFRFNGGSLPLDLIATVYQWDELRIDRIDSSAAWDAWLRAAGVVPPAIPVDEGGLREMRRLRAAVQDAAKALVLRREAPAGALGALNEFAGDELPGVRIAQSGAAFVAVAEAPTGHGHLLTRIARETIDLLTGVRAERVRRCADAQCPTIFVDKSQAGGKLWCSAQCGARAATRNYRSRRAPAGERAA